MSIFRKTFLLNLHVLPQARRMSIASFGLTSILAVSACGDDGGGSEEGSTSATSTGDSTTSATSSGSSTSGSTTTSDSTSTTASGSTSTTTDEETVSSSGSDASTASTGTDTEGDLQSRFGAACESYYDNISNCDGDPLASYDAEFCIDEYGYLLIDETCGEAAIVFFECLGALSCDYLTGDYEALCEAEGIAFEGSCEFPGDSESTTTWVSSDSETGTSSGTGDTE